MPLCLRSFSQKEVDTVAADFSITGEVKLNSDLAEKATSKWTVAAGQLIADFAKKAASSLKSVVNPVWTTTAAWKAI